MSKLKMLQPRLKTIGLPLEERAKKIKAEAKAKREAKRNEQALDDALKGPISTAQ